MSSHHILVAGATGQVGSQAMRHWVQSSVPTYDGDDTVPELKGKRLIETRLHASPITPTIVRNPAFIDVWLVMGGAKQATSDHPHATTKRPFGFMKMRQGMIGNLVAKRGILLAPGGKSQGATFIATVDVAHMMAGAVGKQAKYNRTIEGGGPQFLTWGEIASLLSAKTGRPVRVIPLPTWFARFGQAITAPFSPSASNVLALVKLVAEYQPRWEAPPRGEAV